jgi:hypothetical protein
MQSRRYGSYEPRSSRKTSLWWGTDVVHACPGTAFRFQVGCTMMCVRWYCWNNSRSKETHSSPPFNQWAIFLPGEQGLHFDTNPAVLAPHKLSLSLTKSEYSYTYFRGMYKKGPARQAWWKLTLLFSRVQKICTSLIRVLKRPFFFLRRT